MIEKLSETTELMNSSDFKDRFRAEYYQLGYRTERLRQMLENWDNLDFTPKCPKELLQDQLAYMYNYQTVLEKRAKLEEIDLLPIKIY